MPRFFQLSILVRQVQPSETLFPSEVAVHQPVLDFAADAVLCQVCGGHLCQSQGVVSLTTCQDPSIRGDGGTSKL